MEDIRRTSATWDGPPPTVSVVVSTWNRRTYLDELVTAFAGQSLPHVDFEVVIVDNGSIDDTWDVLSNLAERTPLRLLALRLPENHGPARARNHGARHARGQVLAFTDDDCLPHPDWLQTMAVAFEPTPGPAVVQGRVEPHPTDWPDSAPWDHLIWITRPTPFFETCNVAYRATAFHAVGGFDEQDPLFRPASGRAFGEDARLAWLVQRDGGQAGFADEAIIWHRCVPSTFRRYARDVRHATGFPGLAQRSPLVAAWLKGGVFLSRASATYDLALIGAAAAVVGRTPLPLVLGIPWARTRWRDAMRRSHRRRGRAVVVLAQHAVGDLVILGSLVRGSVRHGRVVL